MTVQELIDKLNELPEELRRTVKVRVETENEGGEPNEIRAEVGESKIWWQADRIIISARY